LAIKIRMAAGSIQGVLTRWRRPLKQRWSGPFLWRRSVDQPRWLSAMPLAFRERATHAAIERENGGIEHAPRRVHVPGPQRIRVARQSRARPSQSADRAGSP
jgi:hypothetical protein